MATTARSGDPTPVRDALESLRAVRRNQPCNRSLPPAATPRAPWGGLSATAIAVVLSVAAFGMATGDWAHAACEPITYEFAGSPPASAVAEFTVAAREIHDRSGLVFEEGSPRASKLHVAWSDRGVDLPAVRSMASGANTTRLVGAAGGQWQRTYGGRRLVRATIEVDGNAPWALGMEQGDGLAAVFAHELGHVLGLPHNSDMASFMYERADPRQPRWTAHDLDALADAGRQAGCIPPDVRN